MNYPTVRDALELHEMVLQSTGGAAGVRDQGLLESTLARPTTAYAGVELYPSLWEKAGALTHGVIRNHPFIDGNKRTAMVLESRSSSSTGTSWTSVRTTSKPLPWRRLRGISHRHTWPRGLSTTANLSKGEGAMA